jgi:NAD-dependent dihydropyrimidine dehydrogenase PreA subunit
MKLISKIRDLLFFLFHSSFRHYDFPCECGIYPIGKPGPDSPVFLSGNYIYTVDWLKKVLRPYDCYLLVADSSGSNVWCAAGMNEFTEHDIIDAVNVARLSTLVNHRKLIAPPYGAPGVDVEAVKTETGFRVVWGPAHLKDLPRYIANGFKRTNDMLKVPFNFRDRFEVGLGSATAYIMMAGILGIVSAKYAAIVSIAFFTAQLFSFVFWPWLPSERYYRRTLLLELILGAGMAGYGYWAGATLTEHLINQGIVLAAVILVATDHCGSTSVHKTTIAHWLKSGNYLSLFNPVIDPELCNNCASCVAVCPKNVLARLEDGKKAVVVNPDDCMECLACVKQCDQKAIYDRHFQLNKGKLKGDVKSIPDIDFVIGRDPAKLLAEDRWIGSKTFVKGEFQYVAPEIEAAKSSGSSPNKARRTQATA